MCSFPFKRLPVSYPWTVCSTWAGTFSVLITSVSLVSIRPSSVLNKWRWLSEWLQMEIIKISGRGRARWLTPVIPELWEAEAGKSLEPRRQRLQWAEIMPLHSSLVNKIKTPSQQKEERRNGPPWLSHHVFQTEDETQPEGHTVVLQGGWCPLMM